MNSIKFNKQGIEAILNGSKTMTRRPIKPQGKNITSVEYGYRDKVKIVFDDLEQHAHSKYKVGETIYILEDAENGLKKWPNIFLKITNIKVERLQDISEEDCIKEGLERWSDNCGYFYMLKDGLSCKSNYKKAFKEYIWHNLPYKAPYDWNSNPYVFVYEFEVVK